MAQPEMQQFLRVREVVVHHVSAIIFQRIRTGTLVQNGTDPTARECTVCEGPAKLCFVHVVDETGAGKVHKFLVWIRCVGEIVNNQDCIFPLGIQFMHQIAANESGSACNDNHSSPCSSEALLPGICLKCFYSI